MHIGCLKILQSLKEESGLCAKGLSNLSCENHPESKKSQRRKVYTSQVLRSDNWIKKRIYKNINKIQKFYEGTIDNKLRE